MEYNKQALDTPDLLALLKQRGLVITNEQEALKTLSIISYFRLACYFRPMEADKQTHKFREGSTLEQVMALYEFDTALRDMVFCATRQIEVALRTRINHHFSRNHSPFWFSQVDLATDGHLFAEHLSSVDRELRRSKEEFIKEHFARYDKPTFPPAWKTLELATFGTLSRMYSNFSDNAVKKQVARSFSIPQHEFMRNWLENLTVVRNICAHHARLWNNYTSIQLRLPHRLPYSWLTNFNIPEGRLYPQLCCIAYWLNSIDQKNTFVADFKALLTKYPTVDTAAMGFPRGWQQEPLWH